MTRQSARSPRRRFEDCGPPGHCCMQRATAQRLSSSTMKRVTMSLGNALRDEEMRFFDAHLRHQRPPAAACTIVVNVDALSFNIRGEGYKQATVATISFLDAAGDRLQ